MKRTILAAAVLVGCVDIGGGAVELGWKLYRRDGIACCPDENPCRMSQTGRVIVHLTPTAGGATVDRLFACDTAQGSTRFDIPPGLYSIAVEGLCQDSAKVIAPGPGSMVREIKNGDVAVLGAIALTLDSTDPCCRPAGVGACP